MTIHRLYATIDDSTTDVSRGEWRRAADHLQSIMKDDRFTPRYLSWLYDENPDGESVAVDICDDDGQMIAHGAALPVWLRSRDRSERFVLSVNSAVLPESRGRNLFATKILEHIPYVLEQGVVGGFGVTNERSTVPAVSLDGLGATLIGQLNLKVCPPMSAGVGVVSYDCSPGFLRSAAFEQIAESLDRQPARHWVRTWSPDALRRRLGRPATHYVLHVAEDAVAVKSFARGVPVAVLLKLLPRGEGDHQRSGRGLVAAACRYHRAPSALYAGFNSWVGLRGISVPRERMPAPLNLLFLSLSDIDQAEFRFDTFELLDFDAF